ncbi:MAG: protein TolR [Alphaproteobacteria bacterium]
MSEINVTPMVDVMLVLLIVFMVTAPLLTVGVPVDLPKTAASALNESTEPLVVSIDKEGLVYLQETEIELGQLAPRLAAVVESKADTRVYVRGDAAIDYGRVMQIMGTLRRAGFERIALVAEMPRPAARGKGRK